MEEEPTEVVRAAFSVAMACGIHYVDFEGLVDGRSVKNIIKNMQPRRARVGAAAGGGASPSGACSHPSPMGGA